MVISPRFRNLLIERIGKEIYYRMSGEVKRILIYDEINKFKQEIIGKFGSMRNYTYQYVRKLGYKTIAEYNLAMIKMAGFDSYYEYQTILAREKGYKSRWYRFIENKKNKYPHIMRPIDLMNQEARNKGYPNHKEYEEALYKSKGFRDRKDYRRFKYLRRRYLIEVVSDSELRNIQLKKEKRYGEINKNNGGE